jgi:hypothetical protein
MGQQVKVAQFPVQRFEHRAYLANANAQFAGLGFQSALKIG